MWAALRQRRRDLADEHNVPAYMIFGDATLKQMLEKRPMSLEAMYGLSGVGDRILAAFGTAFLEVLQAHRQRHGYAMDSAASRH